MMVMCPKQKQTANWSQVEIEILIVKGRNLPRTNSTKSETQNIFAKKQENEHTPGPRNFTSLELTFIQKSVAVSASVHINNVQTKDIQYKSMVKPA